MGKRPVIGIMPGYDMDKGRLYTAADYVDGITRGGGLPCILPLDIEPGMAEQIIDTFDGFLFTGGPDVDARAYGEENRKCQGGISPLRDKLEQELARLALNAKKPVLGICRGIQLLNVAMGGTLHQDIYSGRDPSSMLKHWQEAPDWYAAHDVSISCGSLLHKIYGTDRLPVNSYHHQAIKEPAAGLVVTAVASDGIIEAVEGTQEQFIIGVQWHPESMWRNDPLQLKLFRALVEAAGQSPGRH
jgi:putative glutamine amidotransferase